MAHIASSVMLFVLAGLAEIGGSYLVWSWWRNGRAWPFGALVCILGVGIVMYAPRTH